MTRLNSILTWLCVFLPVTPIHAGEFRAPSEMTNDDWKVINEAQTTYYNCLQEKMVEYGETSDDPRTISDQVLDICSVILIKLDQDMGERNMNPHFTQRYIYNTKNKAARQLLRNLMMMIASRQQQNDPETAENSGEIND